jgi:hypothetical protein
LKGGRIDLQQASLSTAACFRSPETASYNGLNKYVPIDSLPFMFLVSGRVVFFRSGSCQSKLERVNQNIIKALQGGEQIKLPHYIFKAIVMFAFRRFYLRVFADPKEIIRQRKRNVVLATA